jgi:hypothetical protein
MSLATYIFAGRCFASLTETPQYIGVGLVLMSISAPSGNKFNEMNPRRCGSLVPYAFLLIAYSGFSFPPIQAQTSIGRLYDVRASLHLARGRAPFEF